MSPLARRAKLRHVPMIERRRHQAPLVTDRVVGIVMIALLVILAVWQIHDATVSRVVCPASIRGVTA